MDKKSKRNEKCHVSFLVKCSHKFFKLFTSFIAVILPTFYDAKKRKIKSLLAPSKIT